MELEIFNLVLLIWCIIALITFFVLIFIPAPYGRHSRSFGPKINGTIGWIIMEVPSVVIYPIIYFKGNCVADIYNITFFALWEMHYIHRTFIYAWRRTKTLRTMPLSIMLLGLIFNGFNAYLNSYAINVIGECSQEWIPATFFLIGVALFILGFFINFVSDETLLKLRQQGDIDYKIPSGWLYRYVSCPNYFGEIVEWFGFFLATLSPAAFAFFLWTCANLIPRALSHHTWYRETFPQYPQDRKAVFPYLL